MSERDESLKSAMANRRRDGENGNHVLDCALCSRRIKFPVSGSLVKSIPVASTGAYERVAQARNENDKTTQTNTNKLATDRNARFLNRMKHEPICLGTFLLFPNSLNLLLVQCAACSTNGPDWTPPPKGIRLRRTRFGPPDFIFVRWCAKT